MLDDRVPEYWARDATLAELQKEARSLEAWTERDAEVLDHAYRDRCLRLLGRTRQDSQDEARALVDHLERVAHDTDRDALDGLSRPYFTRWRLLAEMVADFALRLEAPSSILARKHVREILHAVHDHGGRLAQSALGRIIANEGQRSATLKLMENWDLVERAPGGSGNSRDVVLTDLGRLAIADQVEEAAVSVAAPRMKRGIEYMSRVA